MRWSLLVTCHFTTWFSHFAGHICHHYWHEYHPCIRSATVPASRCALVQCLTFIYSFEALCADGEVCGKPQGQYRSTADYRGGQHESWQPEKKQRELFEKTRLWNAARQFTVDSWKQTIRQHGIWKPETQKNKFVLDKNMVVCFSLMFW